MTLLELLLGKKEPENQKKTEKEKRELERKIWEMAEEYEEDD